MLRGSKPGYDVVPPMIDVTTTAVAVVAAVSSRWRRGRGRRERRVVAVARRSVVS